MLQYRDREDRGNGRRLERQLRAEPVADDSNARIELEVRLILGWPAAGPIIRIYHLHVVAQFRESSRDARLTTPNCNNARTKRRSTQNRLQSPWALHVLEVAVEVHQRREPVRAVAEVPNRCIVKGCRLVFAVACCD